MIDFSTLKGLTIPVEEIQNVNVVLSGYGSSVCYAIIDGVRYDNGYYSTTTIQVPKGSVAQFYVNSNSDFEDSALYINDELVASYGNYEHILNGNATIKLESDEGDDGEEFGVITITETPISGVVTQIADASGRVLWKLETSKPVILQVEKITSATHAGGTTYESEQFILLDIYPKTNGTVKVTYGGLTKTIKDTSGAAEPNAQPVFFGTFNGVSDSVDTPASGELTIEGDYYAYGCGSYQATPKEELISRSSCITGVVDWGDLCHIADYAFSGCKKLNISSIPEGITTIGAYAFANCEKLNISSIPEGVTTIGDMAFQMQQDTSNGQIWYTEMRGGTITLPSTLESIGTKVFASGEKGVGYLSECIIHAMTPPSAGSQVFGDRTYLQRINRIVVPSGCGDVYKAAGIWGYYKNEIVEAS